MKIRLFLLVSLSLIIVLTASLFALLHQNGSSDFSEPQKLTEPPPVLWQIDLEHFATDFVVYGGRVFACDHWGNVLCFDAANGKLLWNKDVGGYVGSTSSVTVYDGKLYYGSRGSVVCRLDPNTGMRELTYEAPVTSSFRSKSGPDFFVADGRVFAEADGTAVYNASNGELLWEHHPNSREPVLTEAGISAPDSDYVYMKYVWRIDTNNGSIIWKPSFRAKEPMIVTEDKVIFWNCDPFEVSEDEQTVFCVNASSGETLWSFDAGAPIFQPTEYDGLLLFGASDGNFYALHTQNGTLAWKTSVGSQNIVARGILPAVSPVIVDSETQNVLWSFAYNHLEAVGVNELVQYCGVICSLDLKTGDLQYTNQFVGNGTIDNNPKVPLIGLVSLKGNVFLTAGDDLWILDQSTGNSLGMRHFEHYLFAPIVYRTRVYVAADLFLFAYK